MRLENATFRLIRVGQFIEQNWQRRGKGQIGGPREAGVGICIGAVAIVAQVASTGAQDPPSDGVQLLRERGGSGRRRGNDRVIQRPIAGLDA